MAEVSYERLHQLLQGSLASDAPRILYAIGMQLSKRLLLTTRKASRLAFLDVGIGSSAPYMIWLAIQRQ